MPQATRRTVLTLAAGALCWPVIGRAAPVTTLEGRAFGTHWRVSAPDLPPRLQPAIESLFAGIDRDMSPWRTDSAVSAFNAAARGDHAVPPPLAKVAEAALRLARDSGGAFDPTVGPMVARWGFGPIRDGAPGWRRLAVEGDLIRKETGATLDLCGIAKGWALDRVRILLRETGTDAALIDLGGELAALGQHPEGRDWRVAVENPLGGAPVAALRLAPGKTLATSGLAAQGYRLGGRVYSHIIDPATKQPVAGALRSVTVLDGSAMIADGWATALCAAGQEGPALARARGLSALFLLEDPGGLRPVRTGRIGEFLA